MLHSVLTYDDGMERQRGMTYLCVLAMMVELWMRKTREMRDDDVNYMEDLSGHVKSGPGVAWLALEDLILVVLPPGLGLVPSILGMVN